MSCACVPVYLHTPANPSSLGRASWLAAKSPQQFRLGQDLRLLTAAGAPGKWILFYDFLTNDVPYVGLEFRVWKVA